MPKTTGDKSPHYLRTLLSALKSLSGRVVPLLQIKFRYLRRRLRLEWGLADRKQLALLALTAFFYFSVVWLSIYAGATYWDARQLVLDREVQREVRVQEMIRENLYLRKENNELKQEIEKLRSARSVPLGGTTEGSVGGYPTGECFNLSLLFPIQGSVIVTNFSRYHPALDIAGDYGEPILASYSGRVASAGWHTEGYGYSVFLNIGGGWQLRYAHLSKILVRTGQEVAEGQVIGLVGNSGSVVKLREGDGSHLHLEMLCSSVKVDPSGYLQ